MRGADSVARQGPTEGIEMNKPWIAAIAALLLAPGAYAGVGQGDIEAGISVSLTSTSIDLGSGLGKQDSDSGDVQLSGGYFVNDMIEVKAALAMSVSTDFTSGEFKPGADFLFAGKEALVPFAGAAYALGIADTKTDYIDLHGGVKYFFRENTSIEGKLQYLMATDSAYSDVTELTVGLNIYF